MKKFFVIVSIILLSVIHDHGEVEGSYNPNEIDGKDISSSSIFTKQVGDLFSMDIKDITLSEVLTRISDKSGITFLLPSSLAEEKVMVRFSNLKLEEGLSKILHLYNTIFIYSEEADPSSTDTLTEVRIYPLSYRGRGEEAPLIIKRGSSSRMVKDEVKDEDKIAIRAEKLKEEVEKDPIEGLLLGLQDEDSRVRMEAVRALAKIDDERVIRPLSLAMKDNDQGVKKEAKKALKVIGETMKEVNKEREEIEKELNGDDTQNVADGGDEPADVEPGKEEPAEGENSVLILGSTSGNAASLELDNDVPVKGVQFTLSGAQPVEVRTTSRSEGFFAQFNKENGTVIMLSLSGNTIKPGTGPIAEIVCDHTGSASLSGVKIVE